MYFIYDNYYLKHENGISHPENPERLKYIKEKADSLAGEGIIEYTRPAPAEVSQIEMVHDPEYIKMVERLSAQGGLSFLDMDTGVNQYTYSCALLAAGGCLYGMDLILEDGNKYKQFFLACRPPGHHAFPSRGSGFCIFNNAALGARYAGLNHGIKKTAIVDFDAHHGNGTQDIFYEDDSVFYISFHQYPHYPGSGDIGEIGYGKGEGFNLNLPFMPETGEPDYLVALVDIILPVMQKFQPELLIVSAGYDSHFSDYMSSLGLVEGSYKKIMNAISFLARHYCEGRMAVVLEGGYEHQSTAESVAATIMGSRGGETEGIDDLEGYFNIDEDYRNNRVKNNMVLEQLKKAFGLQG
jgi:acetoin utilization deacetylase AcuC-like enzyme